MMFGKWTKKIIAVSLAFLISGMGFPVSLVLALPEGGTVVGGQGTINQPTAQDLTVNQSTSNLIINWQGFNIGAAESVQFFQPSVNSVALNRVVGTDPSRIAGRLSANGQVFITNPSGVIFLPGSKVDVHGLLATTLSITDQDFLDRNYRFFQDPSRSLASILNQGTINASYVGLLAPSVVNRGTIVANLGSVALASGKTATLDFIGDDLINFAITEEVEGTATDANGNVLDHNISNEGIIRATGGSVSLSVRRAGEIVKSVINQEGVIEAHSVVNREGKIFLSGGDNGIVSVTGTLDASGKGAGEKGGTIHVTGEKVGLFDTAKLDASGVVGGGEILIGGDRQGEGELQNAKATFIDEDVSINADAISNGNGGKIIVFAEETARIFGNLSARGGAISGNGGFIETSGKQYFELTKTPDIGATNGLGGEWLIDPFNITFFSPGDDIATRNISQSNPFLPTGNDSFLNVDLIFAALTGGADVTVSTANGGGQAGNIFWPEGVELDYDGTGFNTLSLIADGDINFGGKIFDYTGSADGLELVFNALGAINFSGEISSEGRIFFTAPTIVLSDADINSVNNPIVFTTNTLLVQNINDESIINAGTSSLTYLPFSGGLALGTGPGVLSLLNDLDDDPVTDIDVTASQLIFGNSSTGPVTVDGVFIDDLDVVINSGGSVTFLGAPSVFESLRVVAGQDININTLLTTLRNSGGGGPTRVLLIEDQGGFGDAVTVLTEDGQIVTIINNEFANGRANLLDLAFLNEFDLVVWGARGASFGTVTPENVIANLETYIQGGGNLLVTGYDTIGSPTDLGLSTLVRSAVNGDRVSYDPNWQTTGVDNFILNGAFGDFRNLTFSAIGYDDDQLLADTSRGALTLATFGGNGFNTSDRLIFTPLESGGSVGYWNGGTSGSTTNAQTDFSSGGTPEGIFRNWVDGVDGISASLFASAGGAININADVNTNGATFFNAPSFNITGADVASNNNPITVNATTFAIASSITSGTASTSLIPTAGTTIGLGAGAGIFSISDAELDSIFASLIKIGDSSSGAATVSGASSTTPILLTTGGTATAPGGTADLPNLIINAAGGITPPVEVPDPEVPVIVPPPVPSSTDLGPDGTTAPADQGTLAAQLLANAQPPGC